MRNDTRRPVQRRVLKWTVPVDDHFHPIGPGKVVHVESQFGKFDQMQVWTEEEVDDFGDRLTPGVVREAIVLGTGHPIPADTEHLGSWVQPGGRLVWHVYAGVR